MQSLARNAYQQNEILDADGPELVVLLYRGAIEAIGKARAYQANGDLRERARQVTRAFEIVTELSNAVDREKGGDIASSLIRLYDYIQEQLNRANIEQSMAALDEVEGLLKTLLEGWEGVRAQISKPAAASAIPHPAAAFPQSERKPMRYSA